MQDISHITVAKIQFTDQKAYDTTAEITFIRGLGGWANSRKHNTTRAKLLKNYLASMDKRENWNGMNQIMVREAAEDALKRAA